MIGIYSSLSRSRYRYRFRLNEKADLAVRNLIRFQSEAMYDQLQWKRSDQRSVDHDALLTPIAHVYYDITTAA